MATPGIHAPAPGGGVRRATAGLSARASARVPDWVAVRDMATKLRSNALAQVEVRNRFFIG